MTNISAKRFTLQEGAVKEKGGSKPQKFGSLLRAAQRFLEIISTHSASLNTRGFLSLEVDIFHFDCSLTLMGVVKLGYDCNNSLREVVWGHCY